MTTPASEDPVLWWQGMGVFVAALTFAAGIIKWLLAKIEAVRLSNDQAVDRLRDEVIDKIDSNAKEFREDRNKSQEFRESVLAMMLTRAEGERMLDRQTNQLLDLLDVRFRPLVDERRKKAGG